MALRHYVAAKTLLNFSVSRRGGILQGLFWVLFNSTMKQCKSPKEEWLLSRRMATPFKLLFGGGGLTLSTGNSTSTCTIVQSRRLVDLIIQVQSLIGGTHTQAFISS